MCPLQHGLGEEMPQASKPLHAARVVIRCSATPQHRCWSSWGTRFCGTHFLRHVRAAAAMFSDTSQRLRPVTCPTWLTTCSGVGLLQLLTCVLSPIGVIVGLRFGPMQQRAARLMEKVHASGPHIGLSGKLWPTLFGACRHTLVQAIDFSGRLAPQATVIPRIVPGRPDILGSSRHRATCNGEGNGMRAARR